MRLSKMTRDSHRSSGVESKKKKKSQLAAHYCATSCAAGRTAGGAAGGAAGCAAGCEVYADWDELVITDERGEVSKSPLRFTIIRSTFFFPVFFC